MILNDPRANLNLQSDRFQDFDIIYLVTELAPFVDDLNGMTVLANG